MLHYLVIENFIIPKLTFVAIICISSQAADKLIRPLPKVCNRKLFICLNDIGSTTSKFETI